jgi:hypothetical protein
MKLGWKQLAMNDLTRNVDTNVAAGSTNIRPVDLLPGRGGWRTTGQGAGASPSNPSVVASHDSFVFAPNFGQVTIANFDATKDTIQISQSIFANMTALLAATHDDGNAVITDAAHDTITIQHVTTAQLIAHQSDFHFV